VSCPGGIPTKDCSYPWPNGGYKGYPAVNRPEELTGANLYQLNKPEPLIYATNAIMEYAQRIGKSPQDVKNSFDLTVAAVAAYVDRHMTWRDEATNRQVFMAKGYAGYGTNAGAVDFPQPADLTLKYSGNVSNGTPSDDFLGDCEDFAILRATLLRALCFPPWAIWDVINKTRSHEYNVVLYQGAFRIMDRGTIDRYLACNIWGTWYDSSYGWNQTCGPRGYGTDQQKSLIDQTNNYPVQLGRSACAPWSCRNYFKDTCP
jgi:hypothetical protein